MFWLSLLKWKHLQIFLVLHNCKLNLFEFWIVISTTQIILRHHFELWETEIDILHNFKAFFSTNQEVVNRLIVEWMRIIICNPAAQQYMQISHYIKYNLALSPGWLSQWNVWCSSMRNRFLNYVFSSKSSHVYACGSVMF